MTKLKFAALVIVMLLIFTGTLAVVLVAQGDTADAMEVAKGGGSGAALIAVFSLMFSGAGE